MQQEQIQQEQRRQYYLQALGIDVFIPRSELPNAQHRAAIDWLGEASSVGLSTGAAKQVGDIPSVQGSQAKTNTANVAGLKEELQTSSSKKQSIKTKPGSAELETKQKQVTDSEATLSDSVNFHWRIWQVNSQLLIIDARGQELALPTDALLQNIVRALGFDAKTISQPESLRWPIKGSSNSIEGAKSMAEAFIDAKLQQDNFAAVLLMGKSCAQMTQKQTFSSEDWCWQSSKLNEKCEGITLPSLTDLLREPQLKKNTWQAIRHLCL